MDSDFLPLMLRIEDKNVYDILKVPQKASKNPSLSKGFYLKKAGHLVTTH